MRRGADVLCVGMYRSGSTWQYNVTCDLLECAGRGQRAGFIEGDGYQPKRLNWWGRSRIFKSHDAQQGFASAIRAGRALAIYCERDLRDVVFSIMHKWSIAFEEVMASGGRLETCLRNDVFWRSMPHRLIQRYENIVADPVTSVAEIASFLGIVLDDGEAESIAEAHTLEKTMAHIEALRTRLESEGIDLDAPENTLRHDPTTLFHWNHVRTSQKGWRGTATPSERIALARACGDWLIRRGYEADLSWADTAGDGRLVYPAS